MSQNLDASYGKLVEKLDGWLDQIILNIPNIIIALLVIFIAYLFAGTFRKWTYKLFNRFTSNTMVLNLVCNLSIFIYAALILFLILSIFNLDGTITKILATAGVLGLAVGLALQDPMRNLFSGVYLSVKKLYSIGDLVETNGYFGKIHRIDLRNTILKELSGEEVILPNMDVLSSPLKNFTISGERRVTVGCGVSYGEKLDEVKEITIKAIKNLSVIDPHKNIDFYYTEFGGSSINFEVRFWLNKTGQLDFLNARGTAIMAIKNAFDAEGISIPFPIRTLDFGIKGGEKLNAMLSNGLIGSKSTEK